MWENDEYFYKNYYTFKLKNIISSDFETFKQQINEVLPSFKMNKIVTDEFLGMIHELILDDYANSWVRYDESEAFIQALGKRIKDVAPIYAKRFSLVDEAINTLNKAILGDSETASDNTTTTDKSTNTSESTSSDKGSSTSKNNYKEASTPTAINPLNDQWNYTDLINENKDESSSSNNSSSNQNTTNDSQGTYNRNSSIIRSNILSKLDDLNNWRSAGLQRLSKEFSDLFMQITL